MEQFAIKVMLEMDMDAAEQRVRAALKEQGFGVLTEVDIQATMKAKLDREMGGYKLLGACNPGLAWEALHTEPLVGLLLPCNVILRELEQGTEVAIISPKEMFHVTDLPSLDPLAQKAHAALSAAADALRG